MTRRQAFHILRASECGWTLHAGFEGVGEWFGVRRFVFFAFALLRRWYIGSSWSVKQLPPHVFLGRVRSCPGGSPLGACPSYRMQPYVGMPWPCTQLPPYACYHKAWVVVPSRMATVTVVWHIVLVSSWAADGTWPCTQWPSRAASSREWPLSLSQVCFAMTDSQHVAVCEVATRFCPGHVHSRPGHTRIGVVVAAVKLWPYTQLPPHFVVGEGQIVAV